MENEPIDITTEELMEMVRNDSYDPAIVKSVTSKRKGGRGIFIFTLQDGQVITI